MTRRNNKRNERRNRNHSDNTPELSTFTSMLMGALLGKGAEMIADTIKDTEDKPFNGIRQVSDNHLETGVIIKSDGTATELPIPEGFQVFISEDGKPMIRKKVEDKPAAENKDEGAPITYKNIANKLFLGKDVYYANGNDVYIYRKCDTANVEEIDNCLTEAQAKRIQAFNKLQNISKYLNDGWVPDFKKDNRKFYIICTSPNKYSVICNTYLQSGDVFFKTEELAQEAIRIMGEESLNDLFSTDW